jgi:hypothetical protein
MTDFIYRFKINLKQQVILSFHMICMWVGLILLNLYLLKLNFHNSAFILIAIFFLFIDTLPTIAVHIQYYIINRKSLLILNTTAKELTFKTDTSQTNYSFDEINTIKYYRSYGKGSGWHSFGEYRYYKIVFTDKKEIIITCLMVNDIQQTLDSLLNKTAEKHFKLLCLV